MHQSSLRRSAVALFALVLTFGLGSPAAGQISLVGPTRSLIAGFTRGSDIAFDPVNSVYLSVRATGTQVVGVVTNAAGALVAGPVVVHASPGPDVAFPRVTYGGGKFLVVWHQGDGPNYGGGPGTNVVHSRTVTLTPSPAIGPDVPLGFSAAYGSWWEAGAAVAYSASSQVFLVTWQTFITNEIHGIRVSSGGQPLGSIFRVSAAGEGGRDPGVAWNPNTDEFGVSFSGWDASSPKTSFARVRASDGVVLGQTLIARSGGSFVTDTTFNSHDGTFVVAFASPGPRTAKLNASGAVVALGLSSSTVGTYDGLALAYNPVSRTILMVGHYSTEVGGVELTGDGVKLGTEQNVSAGAAVTGSFHPRVTSASSTMTWAVTYAREFTSLAQQIVQTGGSITPPPPPPPPPGGGSTGGCAGSAPFPGAVCVNGGWVPGSGGSGGGGSTGGCPGTAPFAGAVCQNGGWVPGTGGSGGGGSTGGCPGATPFAGAVCVNGGWVASVGGSGGGGSTGGCPGTAPFAGAVCQNGGWVPGTGGGTGGGSGCPGTAPFAGAVCQNGGWVPGTGGGTGGGSGCPGTAPFAGAVCQNGGWVPGTGGGTGGGSGCPGTAPFAGAVCQNGGWVPGTGGGAGGGSGCPGTAPFAGAVCQNGGWVPGTTPALSSGCATPSPGVGWTCRNGGWLPPGMASATLTPSATLARTIDMTGIQSHAIAHQSIAPMRSTAAIDRRSV